MACAHTPPHRTCQDRQDACGRAGRRHPSSIDRIASTHFHGSVPHLAAFRDRRVRSVARRDAGASQAARDAAGSLGRPPVGSLFPGPRGVDGA
jgi:hypothetical protein